MTGYVITRDGEAVGFITDSELAEFIDGLEIDNQANDPAYREEYHYAVE